MRFLRARELDVEKAFAMFMETLKFRTENRVNSVDTQSMDTHKARKLWPGIFGGELPSGAVLSYFSFGQIEPAKLMEQVHASASAHGLPTM